MTHGYVLLLVRLAAYALLLYGVLRWFEWRNLYVPRRVIGANPGEAGLAFQDIHFVAEDGVALHGWWIPCEDARGTVIYCHGNGENIGNLVDLAADFQMWGLNVLLFDYRGYGNSRGIPTEQGTYRDARAAFEVVRAQYGQVEHPPVVAFGRSLGGAVAIQLAADKPVAGLVVECAFTSTVDIGRHLFPWLPGISWLCTYRYASVRKVPALGGLPKLFAHSVDDEMIPYALGLQLAQAAAEPKRFVELHGGHNECGWGTSAAYRLALQEFFDAIFGPYPPASTAHE